MKIYKRYKLLFIINFLTIVLFATIMTSFKIIKYNEYEKVNITYVKKNQIRIIINDRILKNIVKNNYVYLKSKKKKIKIISITKNIYKEKEEKYHEVFLKINLEKQTETEISIFKRKKELITLFKDCWKED